MSDAHADTRLYLVVHEAFRRTLQRFVTATRELEPARLHRVLGDRWGFVVRGLHDHHEHEDDEFFPAIARACPDEAALIARLKTEHAELVQMLDAADAAVATFEAGPTPEALREAHDAIAQIQTFLLPHLAIEDAELLPAATAKVAADEWEQMNERAMRAISRRDLPIAAAALDEVARSLPPEQRPPPPPLPLRIMVALFWRRRYAKFVEPLQV